jgi:hypothetical protein
MAKAKTAVVKTFQKRSKRRRKGVHAKTKASSMKHSKNYVKLSRGQGS